MAVTACSSLQQPPRPVRRQVRQSLPCRDTLRQRENFAPPATPVPAPADEQPAPSHEAPAEFALFDAFAEDNTSVAAVAAPDPNKNEIDSAPAQPPADNTTSQAETPDKTALDTQPMTDDENRDLLHFTWQTDREDRFSLGPDEFLKLIGPFAAAIVGRPWREITQVLGLDPDGRMQQALHNHQPFSSVTLNWPVDGGTCLSNSRASPGSRMDSLPAITAPVSAVTSPRSIVSKCCGGTNFPSRRRCRRRCPPIA